MSPEDYRAAIASLGLNQIAAAKALGINPRTSRRYALGGVPDRALARVKAQIHALKKEAP